MIKRRSNIVLTGFMGTGKSTVGQIIAEDLGYEFIDTDEAITLIHGPIPKFFEENGELAFRKLEREISDVLSKRSRLVISTGGGLMLDADCVAFLEPVSQVFCLSASAREILKRVNENGQEGARPLLAGGDAAARIKLLLQARSKGYGRYHDVPTDHLSPREVADVVIAQIAAN
ncbi:MAG: shikimate kinase [Acidimicrobiales bacterium]|nr:shikimate kinase [Acidimicrobiales bacterium]